MKLTNNLLSALALLIFNLSDCYTNEFEAKIDYRVSYKSDYTVLQLYISVQGDREFNKYTGIDGDKDYDLTNDLSIQMYDILEKNDFVDFYILVPDYFNKILDLFENEQNRKEAERIYMRNNFKETITLSDDKSIKIVEGATISVLTITLQLHLKLKDYETLKLDSLNFKYGKDLIYTKPLDVVFEEY